MAGSGLGLGGCSSQASQHRKALCAIAKELCDCLENEEHNAKDNRKGRRGAEKSLSLLAFVSPSKPAAANLLKMNLLSFQASLSVANCVLDDISQLSFSKVVVPTVAFLPKKMNANIHSFPRSRSSSTFLT